MVRYYSGIFLIAASTLLLEISLTRLFSVLFFHHFAFLVISTALFGFGFSGIYLLFKKNQSSNLANRLSLAALLFSLFTILSYKAILIFPYHFPDVSEGLFQIIRLLGTYALLAIPFFFSGYVVGALLSFFPSRAGHLYFFDLAGAGIGCLAVLWLVPLWGVSGTVLIASALAGVTAIVFWPGKKLLRWATILFSCIALFLFWKADTYFSLNMSTIFAQKNRSFDSANRKIEYSAWSPVSRIDVLITRPNRLIFLDGGSNVSFMIAFNGKYENLQPRMSWRAVPYVVSPRNKVCIIGPGGGEDVLIALSHGSDEVTAVEMDPLIVEIVQGRYKEFIGFIYNHPSVRVVNDEGRSYLRRSNEQFDLIQQVHNISPMAIASGALNLSESYLLTVEAFREYWQHLRPGGMLAINRWGILRAASIASVALEQEGISNPEDYVIVTSQGRSGGDTGFYLKKGKVQEADIQKIIDSQDSLRVNIEYAPFSGYQSKDNIYYRLLVPSLRKNFLEEVDLVLDAPRDNWPFFDHFQRVGSFQVESSILPKELTPALRFVNRGDLAVFTLLGEAVLLSFLFILLPLLRFHKIQTSFSRWSILLYFAALGAGFILIEISLIQKHILFLGQPVYSISSVLFSLLLSAGVGSLILQKSFKEGKEFFWLRVAFVGIAAVLALEVFAVPVVFDFFLGAAKPVRFLISSLSILPLGVFLGIPFPLGIRILEKRAPDAIPWAWGLNAYATVVGSIVCVILAVMMGFRLNFLIALLIYACGFLALYYGLGTKHGFAPLREK